MLNVIKETIIKLQECDKYEKEIKEERKELKKRYNVLVKLLNEEETKELNRFINYGDEEPTEETEDAETENLDVAPTEN